MDVSLIVSVYKDFESLNVVIESLNRQQDKDFEVIIAEDCETKEMKKFISEIDYKFKKIKHVFQEDIGFRKNKILNKAVRAAEGKYLIFIDGDCFVHRDFIKEYKIFFKESSLLVGRRVMLSDCLTSKIKRFFYVPSYFRLVLSKSTHKEEGLKLPYIFSRKKMSGLIGSNFGLSKVLLEKINGFDEDYCRAGSGEDDDIFYRINLVPGVKLISVRNRALQYHLNHARSNRDDDTIFNLKLLKEKMKDSNYVCKNGLNKL